MIFAVQMITIASGVSEVRDAFLASKVNLGQWMGSATAGQGDEGGQGEPSDRVNEILESLRQENHMLAEADVPEELCCPLTMEPMVQPVVTLDGHTYERAAIEAWLEQHNTSPLTNEPLENKQLIPNMLVKQQMSALREMHRDGTSVVT